MAKTLPADVCVFSHFGWLSPAAVHSANWWFDSGVKIHALSIVTYVHKNFFLVVLKQLQCSESSTCYCFWSTVSKCSTNFEHSFLTDKCSCKMVNTLPSDIIKSSAILCNFNLWSAKTSLWRFLVFSGTTTEFGWPKYHLVCTTMLKVSIPPLNHCFQRSRVWITLIKPLLCLNSIFSHQKAMLYQHMKFRFFHSFENL